LHSVESADLAVSSNLTFRCDECSLRGEVYPVYKSDGTINLDRHDGSENDVELGIDPLLFRMKILLSHKAY
jgi:hypothetical protein